MAAARLRLGLVDASHLHFRNLIRQALECPEIEVVGMAIEDSDLRGQYTSQYPDVPAFTTSDELYDKGKP